MLGSVSTWMGDHLPMGKPFFQVIRHLGKLSLAIPLLIGTLSTSNKLGSKQALCMIHYGLAVQAGVWLRAKETKVSATFWPCGFGRTLLFMLECVQR